MGWEYEGNTPFLALRSGSLRSPPLRAGERTERTETTNTITYKRTKLFSGLDLRKHHPLPSEEDCDFLKPAAPPSSMLSYASY